MLEESSRCILKVSMASIEEVLQSRIARSSVTGRTQFWACASRAREVGERHAIGTAEIVWIGALSKQILSFPCNNTNENGIVVTAHRQIVSLGLEHDLETDEFKLLQ